MLEFILTAIIAGILGNSADRAVQHFLNAVTPPTRFERWVVHLLANAFAPTQRQSMYEEWIAQLHFAKRRERPALVIGLVVGLVTQVRHPVGAKRLATTNRHWSRIMLRVGTVFLAVYLLMSAVRAWSEFSQRKPITVDVELVPALLMVVVTITMFVLERCEAAEFSLETQTHAASKTRDRSATASGRKRNGKLQSGRLK
jgi:hypothetical protein